MRVGVLGPVEIAGDGELSPRDRVVLSVLVVHGHEVVSAERLADALWGEEPPASSGKVVQGCIVRLRKALGPASIETHSTGYRLALGDDDVDLHQFERLLGRAREQLALRSPDRALRTAEEALALWRGRPFDDVDGWDAARVEAVRLEELKLEAEELRLDAALRSGRHHEVLATARGMVDAAPTRERRWELLALAQYRSGSQADALRTLQEARRRLGIELGLDLGPALVDLEQAILRQDEHLLGPSIPAVVDDTCPWPGLLAYSIEDADEFAGREPEIETCLTRLATEGVVVVVGPSGSGKSSVVRAGLAGKLERDGRRVVVLSPGARPLESLRGRVLTSATVLVVDQCEAVAACDDPAERDGFFDALALHAADAPLIVALRADRLGDFSGHPGFARLVEQGLFLLGPMGEPALRTAIERPAHAAGLLLEPGLVDLVVRDVLDEPGALPLMSHALQQTWLRREGRTLTVSGYTETGGIRTAVARSAETVYGELDHDDQAKLRDLLLRLVIPLDDGAPVRTRLPHRAIADDPGYQRLVDQLVDARLLTADGDVVELAHEALARAWPRFRDWQAEDGEGGRMLRHLNGAAAGWDALGRPDSELYRGERLAVAVDWRDRSDPELTAIEEAFLDASVARQRAELRLVEEQVEHERRNVRRLKRLVAGIAVFAALAIVATVVAAGQRDEADRKAQAARVNELQRQAQAIDHYDQALLLAIEARHLDDSLETRGNLLAAIERSPQAVAVIRSETEAFLDLGFTPDGETLLASGIGTEPTMATYDVATRQREASLAGDPRSVTSAISPDGRRAVMSYYEGNQSGGFDIGLNIVDMETFEIVGEPMHVSVLVPSLPTRLSFSPDGSYVAAVTDSDLSGAGVVDAVALVWDARSGGDPILQHAFEAPNFRRDVAFMPDSQRVLVAGAGGTDVVDIASATLVGRIDGAHAPIAVSPDGTTVAAATDPTAGLIIGLFDPASGERRALLAGHGQQLIRLAFSPDGTTLASGGDDHLVMVWDVASARRLGVHAGHAAGVNAVAFSPDGTSLWSGGDDRAVFAWDLERMESLVHLPGPGMVAAAPLPFVSQGMAFDAGGRYVVFPTTELCDFQIRDVETGELSRLSTPDEGCFMSFSADAGRYLTNDLDLQLRVLDRASGSVLAASEGLGPFSDLHEGLAVFAPDGRRVVAVQFDEESGQESLVVLDASTLEPIGTALVIGTGARMVGVAPNGRSAVVVTSSTDQQAPGTAVVLVDLETMRIERSTPVAPGGTPFIGARNNTVSPDGRTVGIGGIFGDVVIVDAATGDLSPLLHAHDDFVESITFSPDGTSFVTTGRDGAVKLWDAATHELVGAVQPLGANHRVRASFLPDHHVLIAYDTGDIVRWDPRADAWEAHACEVAHRNFTTAEWAEFFPGERYRVTCPEFPPAS